MPLDTLSGYNAEGVNQNYTGSDLKACAISRDGSRVVAAIAENRLGVWDTKRLTLIATLVGHVATPYACAISTDGTSAMAVALDNKVHKWIMPAEPKEPPNALDEKARKYFQDMTHTMEDEELSVEEAKIEVNKFVGTCEGLSAVSGEKLEDLFFELADEDAEHVSQEVFVGMFRGVRVKQEESRRKLVEQYSERFRKRARPGKSLSLRMAARVVCNIGKEMDQLEEVGTSMKFESVTSELRNSYANMSNSIEEEEFVAAVIGMLHKE